MKKATFKFTTTTQMVEQHEVSVQIPYYAKHNKLPWYYAIISEEQVVHVYSPSWNNLDHKLELQRIIPAVIFNDDMHEISEQEFNEAARLANEQIQQVAFKILPQYTEQNEQQ